MGTRSATGVRVDGTDKISYNQFDGGLDCVGSNIVKEFADALEADPFSTADEIIEGWRVKARAALLVSEKSEPTDAQIKQFKQHANRGVSSRQLTEWYVLLRELQGSILGRLDAGVFIDNNGFINDSLFCEWAYVLNLDEKVLEVYRGFQEKRRKNAGRYMAAAVAPDDCGYWPCALIAAVPITDLPKARDHADGLADWLVKNEHTKLAEAS